MGKVFSAPTEITKPEFNFRDIAGSQIAENEYVRKISEWAMKNSKDKANAKYIGKAFRIPMADGYACYIVYSLKPVQLIHLPIGDEWDSDMATQVNARYIQNHVNLFSK